MADDATLVFNDAVCAPAYRGLTNAQQQFLDAMARDWPRPSVVSEIARRLGKSRSGAGAYRRSLIDANMIEQTSQGEVAYAIPYFGEYMTRLDT